ncbi:MAG TPA: MBL fold metallo-hydrolase [Puia sp.]|nr:MBL fold metallo-hydrolase [Puia sp.]
MTISFLGAAGTVTGTKHLITLDDGRRILLDCGLFQGMGNHTASLNSTFGFDPAELHAVLLSHAHIDHSGLLPKLVADGFRGKIFCTRPTRELTEILLMDSAQIQAHASRDPDRQTCNHASPDPNPQTCSHATPDPDQQTCYTEEDVKLTMDRMTDVEFDRWFEPLDNVRVFYTRTGHLAGAAAIYVDLPAAHGRTSIAFSGDVGRATHPLWRPATEFPQADYLLLESTYGDRDHNLLLSNVDILLGHIRKTCLGKKGKLVIPAFSVGRTQELLYVLRQLEAENRLPDLQYFVDSPLGIAATRVLAAQTTEYVDKLQQELGEGQDPFGFKGLKYVEATEDSIRLREYQEPCVIIASSGTADAGRVRFHIRDVVGDPRHTILFSGYCGLQSLGGVLLSGKKKIDFEGQEYEVKAAVKQLRGLSAHGDANDLCKFIGCQDPSLVRGVYIIHGERHARERLSARLKAKGFYPVNTPEMHESVVLNRHAAPPPPAAAASQLLKAIEETASAVPGS